MPKFQAKIVSRYGERTQVKIIADDKVYGLIDFPKDLADEFIKVVGVSARQGKERTVIIEPVRELATAENKKF